MSKMQQRRLTRKQKRRLQNAGISVDQSKNNPSKNTLQISSISPLTENQKLVFNYFADDQNMLLHGVAGTGKSFLSLYLSIKQIIDGKSPYGKVVIVRSVVPTRDMGFLPGSSKDKSSIYEAPYTAICTELFGRGDAYALLCSKGYVEFISTSFVRGITFNDSIIIADEIQNMSSMELHSVITRVGKNCKILFCGDVNQDDLTSERKREVSGLKDFMKIIKKMESVSCVDFGLDDIVRGKFVKEYLTIRHQLGFS